MAATDAVRSPLVFCNSRIAILAASSTDSRLQGWDKTRSKSFSSVLRLFGRGCWASCRIFDRAEVGHAPNVDGNRTSARSNIRIVRTGHIVLQLYNERTMQA